MGLFDGHEFSPFFGKDLRYAVKFEDGTELKDLYGIVMDPNQSQIFEEYRPDKYVALEMQLYSDEPLPEGIFYRQRNVTVIGTPVIGDSITVTLPESQMRYMGLGVEPYENKYMFYIRNPGNPYLGNFYIPSTYMQMLNFMASKLLSSSDLREFETLFPQWDSSTAYYPYDIVTFNHKIYQKNPQPVVMTMAVSVPDISTAVEYIDPSKDPSWMLLADE